MTSYWRELTDCESDKELVRAGLAYYAGCIVDGSPRIQVVAFGSWASEVNWDYAIKYRRLWVLVEEDDSPTNEE